MILSRAPVRILDIGGWTDTWFYPNGAVFNICIDLYSNSRIFQNNLHKTRIFAENLEQKVEISNLNNILYDGKLDLLKAAVKRMDIKTNLDIYVRADAPPGCGTGTSASVAVSLISALSFFIKRKINQQQIAHLAHKLETEELHLESGVQDQFAASYGGINFMEINYPNVKVTKININKKKIALLENLLILVYLGARSSSEMHKAVIKNYHDKDQKVIFSFEKMKECAFEMKRAIKLDISDIGMIMNKNWEAQKDLHSLMTNNVIKKAEEIAHRHGALGFKCNGAGGGGSATILADIGREYQLKKELIDNGYTILPIKLCFDGVYTFSI
jgi:D-glycero-alpha-D-manno-heptose-7-phosphate kinase